MNDKGKRPGENGETPEEPPVSGLEDPELLLPATIERNERLVRDKFWPKLRRVIAAVPFVDELLAAYFCATDPQTPNRVRGVLLAALVYFIVPMDMIPDIILSLGFTDDATVLTAALALVGSHITDTHRKQAADALGKEFPERSGKENGGQ
ncbi:MAG: YkvA family protein [Alphaproteobacteria bacterium]